jgi:oxygen-independent coproporphyrinogen-3 oxidase
VSASVGVYVHFPWCLRKCPYCDFVSFEARADDIDHDGYADAVLAELEARAAALADGTLGSVFFGGGTPSLWRAAALGRVLARIVALAGERAPSLEVTVECNPSSLDEARARALVDVGVNRLSVGVQGLANERLAFLGRLHDAAGGLRALRAALESGAERVSADLIYGVATGADPTARQRPERAAAEARTVAETGPGHLSCYALTIEAGTRFGELARAGRLPLLDETLVSESFTAVEETLAAHGFEHYEISSYARPGEQCRHNLGYWRGDDYLGIGCAAVGTLSGERISDALGPRPEPGWAVRYKNPTTPARYLAAVGERRFAPAERELLSPETRLRERIMLGLRLREGVDLEAAAGALGAEPWPARRRNAARDLAGRGRLAVEGGRMRVPPEATLFTDGTAAALF